MSLSRWYLVPLYRINGSVYLAKFVRVCLPLFLFVLTKDSMGKDAAIPELHKTLMLLGSIIITYSLQSTAARLFTEKTSEFTREYVVTNLINEYKAGQFDSDRSIRIS